MIMPDRQNVKKVYDKNQFLPVLTHSHFLSNIFFFLLWVNKKDILWMQRNTGQENYVNKLSLSVLNVQGRNLGCSVCC